METVIEPGWILPVEPEGVVLTQSGVAVKDGRIEAILPVAQLAASELLAAARGVQNAAAMAAAEAPQDRRAPACITGCASTSARTSVPTATSRS